VKGWIEEVNQYVDNKVTVIYSQGKPRFQFFDAANNLIGPELEVSSYTKDEIHALLESKGLQRIKN